MPAWRRAAREARAEQRGWRGWLHQAYGGVREGTRLAFEEDVAYARGAFAYGGARAMLGFGVPGPHGDTAMAFRQTIEHVSDRLRLHLHDDPPVADLGDPADRLGVALARGDREALQAEAASLGEALRKQAGDATAYGRAPSGSRSRRAPLPTPPPGPGSPAPSSRSCFRCRRRSLRRRRPPLPGWLPCSAGGQPAHPTGERPVAEGAARRRETRACLPIGSRLLRDDRAIVETCGCGAGSASFSSARAWWELAADRSCPMNRSVEGLGVFTPRAGEDSEKRSFVPGRVSSEW